MSEIKEFAILEIVFPSRVGFILEGTCHLEMEVIKDVHIFNMATTHGDVPVHLHLFDIY